MRKEENIKLEIEELKSELEHYRFLYSSFLHALTIVISIFVTITIAVFVTVVSKAESIYDFVFFLLYLLIMALLLIIAWLILGRPTKEYGKKIMEFRKRIKSEYSKLKH